MSNLLPAFHSPTSLCWRLCFLHILLSFYSYGIWPFGFFKKLGIAGPRPIPFFGTVWEYRKGFLEFDSHCARKYGKIWGIYDGRQPVLAILDAKIIKSVLVKDCYTTFTNRRRLELAGVLETAVSLAMDEQWKRIRTVLSPTFTSGKLKEMFPIIKHYAEALMKNIEQKLDTDESINVKEVFGAYRMDVVTSTSFGVNIDSMNNPKDPFVKEIKKLVKFRSFDPLFVLIFVFPFVIPVLKKMNVNIFPKAAIEFFTTAVAKMKATRLKEGRGVSGILLVVEPGVASLTDAEILAQAFIFIFAGYEPTSNSLSYIAYNLAIHPDVQQKLQEEVDSILPNKAPLTYDALMQMEYLDMIINETQRLYPLGGRIERVCKQDVEINGVNIPKGTVVMIPPYNLHRDPEYWPEPEEFRPERYRIRTDLECPKYEGPRLCRTFTGIICSRRLVPVRRQAAAFCTSCSLRTSIKGRPT
uniref:Cytochrome P450 3A n=1 Tax=Sphenodon punctatus TaxID=8508 RepID=A0A8D0G8C5_SPHPU